MDEQRDKILEASWEAKAAGKTVRLSILQLSDNCFLINDTKNKKLVNFARKILIPWNVNRENSEKKLI